MTRHGLHCTMATIPTPWSPRSLVPGPGEIAPVNQCSIAMVCVGTLFVSKTTDYASARSLSSAAQTATKTVRNPLSP